MRSAGMNVIAFHVRFMLFSKVQLLKS